MTTKQVEEKLTELVHREPFVPFFVEMVDGTSFLVARPPAFDENGAVYFGPDGALVNFWFKNVRSIRLSSSEAVA